MLQLTTQSLLIPDSFTYPPIPLSPLLLVLTLQGYCEPQADGLPGSELPFTGCTLQCWDGLLITLLVE